MPVYWQAMRTLAAVVLLSLTAVAQNAVDLSVVDRIKTEAFDRSQVMEHLYYLTDVYGPRLTGSPEFNEAAKWAMERLQRYGVANVHTERWGPFGRAWSVRQYAVEMMEPRYVLLDGAPLAWSASTNGPVTGELVMAPLHMTFREDPNKREAAFQEYKAKWTGKLRGKIVLLDPPRPPRHQEKPQFHRYTDAELRELATAPEPAAKLTIKDLGELKWPENPEDVANFLASLPPAITEELYDRYARLKAERGAFFAKEGVLGVLTEDQRAHEGMVFAEAAGSYKSADPLAPPTFVVTAEQYNRIARAVERKSSIQVRFSLNAPASDHDVDGVNIIGEIPGGAKKNEIVMIGAHFDSWHSGAGATDNAAGSAVMIEVMRILSALHLKLDRTVRIALWGGEEQGLLGSRAYVKEHFADPKSMNTMPEYARLSGYFNLDNGSGKIRGVYLQGHEAMRPLFERWLAPFHDLGVSTITIRNTGGTDHLSFNAVGLPGFQFIQDPLDYSTITHHSSMDTYDHVVAGDLMQAAAVIATCVYEAANRPELLPRREPPAPQGQEQKRATE
jgi:carboxypeptidase Q